MKPPTLVHRARQAADDDIQELHSRSLGRASVGLRYICELINSSLLEVHDYSYLSV